MGLRWICGNIQSTDLLDHVSGIVQLRQQICVERPVGQGDIFRRRKVLAIFVSNSAVVKLANNATFLVFLLWQRVLELDEEVFIVIYSLLVLDQLRQMAMDSNSTRADRPVGGVARSMPSFSTAYSKNVFALMVATTIRL